MKISCRLFSLGLASLLPGIGALQAQPPSPSSTPEKAAPTTYSPTGTMAVEQFWKDRGHSRDREIWLVSADYQSQRRLLFTHQRSAAVIFSPEETWLAINHHAGSGYSGVLLYRRKAGLEYEKVADLTELAWNFFKRRNGLKEDPFDHAYANALGWTNGDSPSLLIGLSGHISDQAGIFKYSKGWYCLYHVQTKTFTTNLDALNKENVHLQSR